jgi:hypothetical protein
MKRQRIIKMIELTKRNSDGSFTLTGDIISQNGFYQGQDGRDIKYIMKICNELGYRCRCGIALHCFEITRSQKE